MKGVISFNYINEKNFFVFIFNLAYWYNKLTMHTEKWAILYILRINKLFYLVILSKTGDCNLKGQD